MSEIDEDDLDVEALDDDPWEALAVPASSSRPPTPGGPEAGAISLYNTPQEDASSSSNFGINVFQRQGFYPSPDDPSATSIRPSSFSLSWARAQDENSVDNLKEQEKQALRNLLVALQTGVSTDY